MDKVELLIKLFSEQNFSYWRIKKELMKKGSTVSKSKISRIINNIGKKRLAIAEGRIPSSNFRTKKTRNLTNIKKVQKIISNPNPISQSMMANKLGISLFSVNKIIHSD